MGTRCLIKVVDEGEELCCLYGQCDGYPEGHGKELAKLLTDMPIVDGYTDTTAKSANGIGCLAAQIVAHFKKGVGRFYLYPPKIHSVGEEFVYIVSAKHGDAEATIKVIETGWVIDKADPDTVLIEDKASKVLAWCIALGE